MKHSPKHSLVILASIYVGLISLLLAVLTGTQAIAFFMALVASFAFSIGIITAIVSKIMASKGTKDWEEIHK